MLALLGWATGKKFDISHVLIGILIFIAAILLFSGFNTIMGKLGFETVASMRVKLDAANKNISELQTANESLIKQAKQAEERHASELAAVTQLLTDQQKIATDLATTKQRVLTQNANLKKQLAATQEEAYILYNIPKDKYYVYSKEIISSIASNNYDAIFSFIGAPLTEVPKVVQDKRNIFQKFMDKGKKQVDIPNPPLLLTPKLQQ